jgi:hypothetical protein
LIVFPKEVNFYLFRFVALVGEGELIMSLMRDLESGYFLYLHPSFLSPRMILCLLSLITFESCLLIHQSFRVSFAIILHIEDHCRLLESSMIYSTFFLAI